MQESYEPEVADKSRMRQWRSYGMLRGCRVTGIPTTTEEKGYIDLC
jgi:hypothetical protein